MYGVITVNVASMAGEVGVKRWITYMTYAPASYTYLLCKHDQQHHYERKSQDKKQVVMHFC